MCAVSSDKTIALDCVVGCSQFLLTTVAIATGRRPVLASLILIRRSIIDNVARACPALTATYAIDPHV